MVSKPDHPNILFTHRPSTGPVLAHVISIGMTRENKHLIWYLNMKTVQFYTYVFLYTIYSIETYLIGNMEMKFVLKLIL